MEESYGKLMEIALGVLLCLGALGSFLTGHAQLEAYRVASRERMEQAASTGLVLEAVPPVEDRECLPGTSLVPLLCLDPVREGEVLFFEGVPVEGLYPPQASLEEKLDRLGELGFDPAGTYRVFLTLDGEGRTVEVDCRKEEDG
ncbi:hypothetical protein [Anaerotalea alkaliphila]|uniref:Uncharacterized protein n=1 Tax=Anaerotalea alkaliphila TaxID=2662126 RepID=A0A7X5HTH6_9FIRM|nr:hypothetical protein [Anaerotalea alkaliphila]NDL66382.1 hypothetical protein [Anaerotalea alkaliphila]